MERSVRCLLAWMNEADAVTSLLGHIPAVGEDTQAQEVWVAAQAAKNARNIYEMPTPVLSSLPAELADLGAAFSQRPDVIAIFQGMDWQVGMADLNQVLSFQRIVVQEQVIERVAKVDVQNPQSIFSFCLPDPADSVALAGAIDQDQKGITISSHNPNLRVGGQLALDVDVATGPGQASTRQKFIGFTISFGAGFVQIAEYNGRWFVRDGYHRSFGLLRRGVTHIPCVFIRARGFEELGASAPSFFPYDVLFADRPPFVKDFLDDSVSVTASQLAHQKVVRIKAEEFVVAV